VGDGRSQVWGEREVFSENDDCRTLDNPLTLILGLMVDSDLMQPPSAQQAPQAETIPMPDESRFEPEPARRPEPSRPPPPWETALDALASIESGVLPQLAVGGTLAVLIRPPYVPDFRLHVAAFMPQERTISSTGLLRFTHARAGLQLCAALAQPRSLRFDACAGVNAGLLEVTGEGLIPERSVTRSLLESTLTARAALALTSALSLVVVGDLVFPWQTDRFVFVQAGNSVSEAHEISPFVIDLGIGLGMRFR
jgi:hypothetical protein